MRAPLRGLAVALLAAAILLSGCGHLVVLHDPLTAAEHHDLGVAYERDGRLDLAGREYRRALRRDPTSIRSRLALGNVAAAEGRWRAAERSYRRALRLAPAEPDALNNLAVALARQNRRLDEAERLAAQAVARGGRDSIYRATLAEVRTARAAAGTR